MRARRFAETLVNTLISAFYSDLVNDEVRLADIALSQREVNLDSRLAYLMEDESLSLDDALAVYNEENDRYDRETFAWLMNPANFNLINYSDIYKDYYGFRP